MIDRHLQQFVQNQEQIVLRQFRTPHPTTVLVPIAQPPIPVEHQKPFSLYRIKTPPSANVMSIKYAPLLIENLHP